jgi:hypothetical protein
VNPAARPINGLSVYINPLEMNLMAIWRSYLDDSGDPTDPKHSFLTIAGYVADFDSWKHFEARWKAALDLAEVPYLHMREFGDPKGIYKHLKTDKGREIDFLAGLIEIIYESVDFCSQTTIKLEDLSAFNVRHSLQLDPYSLAIYGCLLIMRREYKTEKIEIVLDRFNKSYSRFDLALRYARSDKKETLKEPVSLIPLLDSESFKTILPLQAADFIAWEMRKLCEDRKEWEYSVEDRANRQIMMDSYNRWHERHTTKFGKPPRERKSFLALRESPVLSPQGLIFDEANLASLLSRHPDGWG